MTMRIKKRGTLAVPTGQIVQHDERLMKRRLAGVATGARRSVRRHRSAMASLSGYPVS